MSNPTTNPNRRSAWTLKQNIARVVWGTAVHVVWVLVPPLRPSLIRIFGGRVGRGCSFAGSVEICIPWNLNIGDNCEFGDKSILYSLGPITIGNDVVLDFRAHLCAGTHDMSDPSFPLLRPPITIGDGCLIGADAYVGPNVSLGAGCRVWPRASVYKNYPDRTNLQGNPARPFDPASEQETDVPGEDVS